MKEEDRAKLNKILADAAARAKKAQDQLDSNERRDEDLAQRFLQTRAAIQPEFSEIAHELGKGGYQAEVILDISTRPDPPNAIGNVIMLRLRHQESGGIMPTLCLQQSPMDSANVWIYRRGLTPKDRERRDPDETMRVEDLTVDVAKSLAFDFIEAVLAQKK